MKSAPFSGIVLFFLFSCFVYAQSPGFVWVKNSEGAQNLSRDLAVDVEGNSYSTGSFSTSSIGFGSIVLTNSYAQYSDIFVVKYDLVGNVIWAKSFGSSSSTTTSPQMDIGYAIAVDASHNVYVTGVSFGAEITFGTTTLTNIAGNYIIFTIKLDPDGNVVWAKKGQAGSSGTEIPVNSIASDQDGNVIVVGTYFSQATTFDNVTMPATGTSQMYMVKYDNAGNLVWAKTSASAYNTVKAVTTDALGNIYFAGRYYGGGGNTLILDDISLPVGSNVFIAKCDSSGNTIWAKTGLSSITAEAFDIVINSFGNVAITGTFSGNLTFEDTTFPGSLPSKQFVAVYDSDGNYIWAKSHETSGTSDTEGYRVAADNLGNFYSSGLTSSSSVTFGSYVLEQGSTGLSDFTVKYGPTGNVQWAIVTDAIGPYLNPRNGLGVDGNNNVYLSGLCLANTIFGSQTVGATGIYIAKLSQQMLSTPEHIHHFAAIYPNPSSQMLYADVNKAVKSAKVYDLMGNIFYAKISQNGKTLSVDISGLQSGCYFLEADFGNAEKAIGKFIRK